MIYLISKANGIKLSTFSSMMSDNIQYQNEVIVLQYGNKTKAFHFICEICIKNVLFMMCFSKAFMCCYEY